MEENSRRQEDIDVLRTTDADPGAVDLATQIRREFEKYIQARDAVRKSLGTLRRSAIHEGSLLS